MDDIAGLIVALHRTGTPNIGNHIVPQAERIDFVFEHWIGRHASRGPVVTRADPVGRLHSVAGRRT